MSTLLNAVTMSILCFYYSMHIEYISLYSRIADPISCLKRYVSNAKFEGHFYTAPLKKMRWIWVAMLICSSVGSSVLYICVTFVLFGQRDIIVQINTNLVKTQQ